VTPDNHDGLVEVNRDHIDSARAGAAHIETHVDTVSPSDVLIVPAQELASSVQ
jgi:hypothetical protein